MEVNDYELYKPFLFGLDVLVDLVEQQAPIFISLLVLILPFLIRIQTFQLQTASAT